VGLAMYRPSASQTAQTHFLGPGLAAATVQALPTLIVFVLLQRYFVEGVTMSGIKQ